MKKLEAPLTNKILLRENIDYPTPIEHYIPAHKRDMLSRFKFWVSWSNSLIRYIFSPYFNTDNLSVNISPFLSDKEEPNSLKITFKNGMTKQVVYLNAKALHESGLAFELPNALQHNYAGHYLSFKSIPLKWITDHFLKEQKVLPEKVKLTSSSYTEFKSEALLRDVINERTILTISCEGELLSDWEEKKPWPSLVPLGPFALGHGLMPFEKKNKLLKGLYAWNVSEIAISIIK